MNSIYKTSSNRGLVSTIECLPSPKIAVFSQKVDSRIGEGFNQEDGFEKGSFFLSFSISRPKYQCSILNVFE